MSLVKSQDEKIAELSKTIARISESEGNKNLFSDLNFSMIDRRRGDDVTFDTDWLSDTRIINSERQRTSFVPQQRMTLQVEGLIKGSPDSKLEPSSPILFKSGSNAAFERKLEPINFSHPKGELAVSKYENITTSDLNVMPQKSLNFSVNKGPNSMATSSSSPHSSVVRLKRTDVISSGINIASGISSNDNSSIAEFLIDQSGYLLDEKGVRVKDDLGVPIKLNEENILYLKKNGLYSEISEIHK